MWKKYVYIIIGIAIIIFLLPYSWPLIFAFLTALALESLVKWLIRKFRFSRLQAVISVFIGYVVFVAVIGYYLTTIVISQIVTLSQKIPAFVKEFYRTAIKPLIKKWELYSQNLPTEVMDSIENTVESSINSLDSFMQSFVQTVINFLTVIPGFLIELIIYLVALFMISLELPRLKSRLENHLTEQTYKKFSLVTTQLNRAIIGFIKAQIILSVITFSMAYIGLLILGVPYKALLSLLIVIVDILPILGTGSVLVPWAVVVILQDNHFLGIGLLILFGIITVVRRTVEPKVYSSSLGISPLAALVSIYIGFRIGGIVGVFLGPGLVIVYDALKKANVIKMNFKI